MAEKLLDDFFPFDGKIAFIDGALRKEVSLEDYEKAKAEAELRIPERYRTAVIRAKVVQLLGGKISTGDKINLAALEVFPNLGEERFLGLLVRYLSVDQPKAKLLVEEEEELLAVITNKGVDINAIKGKIV